MTNTHEEPLRALAAKEEEGSGPTAASAAVALHPARSPSHRWHPWQAVLASTALAACGGGSGGADLHDNLVAQQPNLMRRVSEAMTAFYDATVELGVADKVTAFTASDFGRTLSSNGDGSDHGWGSHHFMVGGAVKGRAFYGKTPPVSITNTADANDQWHVGQGRLLPSTSVDQYAAILAKWFGVSNTELAGVLPNLSHFGGADYPTDLGFMAA